MFWKFIKYPLYFLFLLNTLQAQVTSPEAFWGFSLGERFVHHHQVVSYFKEEAQRNKANVIYSQYGTTNEGNPLFVVIISSADNIKRIESIRKAHLASISNNGQAVYPDDKCIVWYSYNVHGNEASGTDAAIMTYYKIMTDPQFEEKFKDIIFILDPCLNPDGRERYVNWFYSVSGASPNSNVKTREHQEPWPGGRTNHYYFDLNRDWAWQTQVESQTRMILYHQWMPQVHADFHEQSYNDPYYFAPAAEPYHKAITSFQRSFQKVIGRKIANAFDKNGWLYFTNERFDLFYPSYGDTYPIYNGAIGMTFEQAGGRSAGLSVQTRDGETLTLKDRILHHTTAGLTTLDAVRENISEVMNEFQKYFQNNKDERYFSFDLKMEDFERGRSFRQLLDRNQIRYSYALRADFSSLLQIPLSQQKNKLINILMEDRSELSDSLTYDITAWNIPKAYGLKYKITTKKSTEESVKQVFGNIKNAYGYAIDWQGGNCLKALSYLLQQNVKVRYAQKEFSIDSKNYRPGTLVILNEGNNRNKPLNDIINYVSSAYQIPIFPISGGMVDSGNDMGSEMMRLIHPPKVVLLTGEGTSSLSAGEVWFYFDKELEYPINLIQTDQFQSLNLDEVNVLILPDGYYSFLNDSTQSETLEKWVRQGGKIIALEGSIDQLSGLKWIQLKRKKLQRESSEKNKYADLRKYDERERNSLSRYIQGAIYKTDLDNSHPLAFGYPAYYYSLKTDNTFYEYMKDGWNVGTIRKNPEYVGFVGSAVGEFSDALITGVKDVGHGEVIFFTDDVLFRNFWENGKLMFTNAVFLVGQ